MWSFATYHLRLSREDFFACTPRQYDWLCRQHKRDNVHREFLFGQVAQTVANFSMRAPEKALKVELFMPSQAEHRSTSGQKIDATVKLVSILDLFGKPKSAEGM